MRRTIGFLLLALVALALPARAHEVRPGYLELEQTGADTFDVLWKVPAAGANLRLGIYVRFPEDSVVTREPIGRFVGDSFVERWSIRHAGGLVDRAVHIDGLATTMTDVIVRFERMDGSTQVGRIAPAHPSLVLTATPDRLELAGTYLVLGVEHILLGIDHLLFVLGRW